MDAAGTGTSTSLFEGRTACGDNNRAIFCWNKMWTVQLACRALNSLLTTSFYCMACTSRIVGPDVAACHPAHHCRCRDVGYLLFVGQLSSLKVGISPGFRPKRTSPGDCSTFVVDSPTLIDKKSIETR